MKVKICGLTNLCDYRDAVELGADYAGFIFYSKSPRFVRLDQVEEMIDQAPKQKHHRVGVFVNESIETIREIYRRAKLDILQLHGDESPDYVRQLALPCWKVIRVKDRRSLEALEHYDCDTFLLDTYKKGQYGGTGTPFAFDLAREALKSGKHIIVAGGISVHNIEALFKLAGPVYAVDVSSSVEEYPGKKSREKMQRFFEKFSKLKSLRRPGGAF